MILTETTEDIRKFKVLQDHIKCSEREWTLRMVNNTSQGMKHH